MHCVRIAAFSLALAFVLAPSLACQSWSVTASAPVVGVLAGAASGSVYGDSVPIGPVSPGTLATFSGSHASASTDWTSWAGSVPAPAPIGFQFACQSSAIATGSPAYAQCDVTLDFLIAAPSPVSGFLRLRGMASVGVFGTTSWEVDINADGTIEMTSAEVGKDVPIHIPSGGITVRVRMFTQAFLPWVTYSSGANANFSGSFYPGDTYCDPFDTTFTSALLHPEPHGWDRWELSLTSVPGGSPLFLVFGFQAMHVALWPGVTQLVTVDAVLPASSGVLIFDLPPMPAGFELYAQGLMLNPAGQLLSSNSVRARWF
jgi:hypothetical protein